MRGGCVKFKFPFIRPNFPLADEMIEDYIWGYLYGKTLSSLSEIDLIKFSDSIYSFYEVLTIKKIKLDYQFSDDDWFELLDILDAYEIKN